jgi:glycine betaine/proline transport system substrate-binding protein
MGGRLTAAMTVPSTLAWGGAALAADSGNPIELTRHDWTGQPITTRFMGEALKNAGAQTRVRADPLDEAAGTGKVENLGEKTGMQVWGVMVPGLWESAGVAGLAPSVGAKVGT